MNNISIYGAGHLTKSLLTGLGRVSDTTISIFNRTESKINDLHCIYRNLEKKNSLDELIKEITILFCIVPGNVLINLDLNIVNKIKQTNSILVSCVNGLSLETLNKKFVDLKIIRLLPNVNWQICEGVSLFDCNNNITTEELNSFYKFLSPVTRLYRVNDDMDFENVGTLTTCSPGLFSTMLNYFTEYFNLESLDQKEMFYEAVKGTIDYILQSRKDPKIISSEVANKGGLTEVGINALQQQFPFCMEIVTTNMKKKIEERKEKFSVPFLDESRRNLRADCENCFGLCCVALYFSASEGFPIDKDAGQPCLNLQPDFRCCVHKSLSERGLKGCIAFDCFGAGQKVAQVSFAGHDWRKVPDTAKQMFEVFLIMRQIHELLWYLTEALTLQPARPIHGALSSMLDETERLTNLSPDSLMEVDVAVHRADVNTLLLKTSELVRAEARRGQKAHSGRQKTFGRGADLIAADLRRMDLRGANLRGALLIAADLRGTDLSGTDFIGADFRDADLRGADLTKSIFLTQAQLNAAKGDTSTKLPSSLTRPTHWGTFKAKSE